MLFIELYQIKLHTAKNYANKGDALLNPSVYIGTGQFGAYHG